MFTGTARTIGCTGTRGDGGTNERSTHVARTHPPASARRHRPGLGGHAGPRGRHGGRRHRRHPPATAAPAPSRRPWRASRPRRPRTSPIGSTTSTRRSPRSTRPRGSARARPPWCRTSAPTSRRCSSSTRRSRRTARCSRRPIDFGTIFSDYRVYRLVLPAARIAADADHATTTAIPNLTADAAKAQARVTPANQATLQPLIDDLNSQISTATNATNGLAATVLAFTPAQWNADNALLQRVEASDQTATGALEKGRADVKQIVQDLKADHAAAVSDDDQLTTERRRRRRLRTAASRCWRSARWPPSSGARPGTRRTRPVPTARSPRRCRST